MDFRNFLEDMGEKPKGYTLDRIDNSGNYEPGNCRWATTREQSFNKRSNRIIYIRGKNLCFYEAIDKYTLRKHATQIYHRLHHLKWSPEKAFFTPVRKWRIIDEFTNLGLTSQQRCVARKRTRLA